MADAPELQLYSLDRSPWSERARWALEHHGLSYQLVQHVPFLGERRLRRAAGNPTGRVTVPLLIAGDQMLTNSWDIAVYADRHGTGTRLIPREQEVDVRRWHDLTERSMSAGRALTMARMIASHAALEEALPAAAPRLMRKLLRPVARYGAHWFARKHELDLAGTAAAELVVREALDALRATLARSEYVLGAFSYADIVAATLLQGVVPVADRFITLGPATREVWTKPELASKYADLIAWRDRLYERHRPPRSSSRD